MPSVNAAYSETEQLMGSCSGPSFLAETVCCSQRVCLSMLFTVAPGAQKSSGEHKTTVSSSAPHTAQNNAPSRVCGAQLGRCLYTPVAPAPAPADCFSQLTAINGSLDLSPCLHETSWMQLVLGGSALITGRGAEQHGRAQLRVRPPPRDYSRAYSKHAVCSRRECLSSLIRTSASCCKAAWWAGDLLT